MRFVIATACVAAAALAAAAAGAQDRRAQPASPTFVGSSAVAAAFAKGAPLVEVDGYKVHASRREAPGMAEVHARDTDIIYVLEGSATMRLGGRIVDGRTVAPDEIRGAAIEHGEERRLVKGDLLIVPNGTPHWFTDVQGTFLYYVVKVTAGTPPGASR